MKVKILRLNNNELVNASIKNAKDIKLPSVKNGWRFDFEKNAKGNTHVYVLITEDEPEVIQGCLIYKMRNNLEPYMAYLETAPHNRGEGKLYDFVAGCLIAFSCRLSFTLATGPYKGWLAFDVQEESEEDQKKLMATYKRDYKARKIDKTMMVIMPKDGEKLIEKYLENL